MAKMNWDKVRRDNMMSRPRTDWTASPGGKPRTKKRFIPPTEKQLKYMKFLGIPYRKGMSLGDCSSLIATTLERKNQNPTNQVNN